MPGNPGDNVNQDFNEHDGNTAPFEYYGGFDIPFVPTQSETASCVTELVGDPNCFEKVTVRTCEYGKEVVVNSVEEGRTKCVESVLFRTIPGEKSEAEILELKKRKLCAIFEGSKELSNAGSENIYGDNAGSIASQRTNGERDSSQGFKSDGKPCMLTYGGCDEPGECTQVNALDFVDHYLLLNNVNFSQVTNCRKTVKDIILPVSKIKGPQILAKRIMSRFPNEETGTFEWDDFDRKGEAEIFVGKEIEKSSEHQLDDNCIQKEDFQDIPVDTNTSTSLDSILEVSLKGIKGMVGESPTETENKLDDWSGKLTDWQMKGTDSGNNAVAYDIGFETQIAAEIMEALSYARSPASCNLADHYHGPEKTFDNSCRGVGDDEAYSEQIRRQNWRRRRRQGTFQSSSNKSGNAASSIRGRGHWPKIIRNQNIQNIVLSNSITRNGISESASTTNMRRKDLRRPRSMAHVRVLFSQHLDNYIIKQQKKVARQLGVSIASSSTDATHFIADKFVRTKNMLEAIALGKPVVTHLWLHSCRQASCFIDEKNYIMRDIKKEREIGFNMPASLAHARKHPLLEGYKILITPNIKPDKEMILCLVKAIHGQPVDRSQISLGEDEQMEDDDLLIISCEEDYEQSLPFIEKGAAVYSPELLLNGIVIQKLEYERHKLFNNQVKREALKQTD